MNGINTAPAYLEKKLPTDIVNYVILPYLLPLKNKQSMDLQIDMIEEFGDECEEYKYNRNENIFSLYDNAVELLNDVPRQHGLKYRSPVMKLLWQKTMSDLIRECINSDLYINEVVICHCGDPSCV